MARIFLSPLVVDIRGGQSRTVFGKWKGRNYIKGRGVANWRGTSAQLAQTQALRTIVKLWGGCAAGVALNNNLWAEQLPMSGFNLFTSRNVPLEKADLPIFLNENFGYDELSVFSGTTGGATGEIDLAFAPSPVPVGMKLWVHVREPLFSQWEKVESFAAATTSPQTLTGFLPGVDYFLHGYLAADPSLVGSAVGRDRSTFAAAHV